MNPANVLGIARRKSGFQNWYLRNTRLGKRRIDKALSAQYGRLEKVLPNGVRKFVENKQKDKYSVSTTTYIEPERFKPIRTTIRTYDKNGKRISLISECIDSNDKHLKTFVNISDIPSVCRRTYCSIVKRYDLKKNQWVPESMDLNQYDRQPNSDCLITTTRKDYIKKTSETAKKTLIDLFKRFVK